MFSKSACPFDSAVIKCQAVGNQFYSNSRLNVEETSFFSIYQNSTMAFFKGVSLSLKPLPSLPPNCILSLLSRHLIYSSVVSHFTWNYMFMGFVFLVKIIISLKIGRLFFIGYIIYFTILHLHYILVYISSVLPKELQLLGT